MKVALVHDYLFEYGGAERVLEALHQLYPDAPVFTSFVDQKRLGIHWSRFSDWDIRQSMLTRIPFHKKFFSPLRIFAMWFFEQFDLSEYDVVISSSNAYFAKAVLTKSWTPHICYCHTPPRSLYGYTTMTDWKKNSLTRLVGTLINRLIKNDDYLSAQRVDFFIANSKEVQNRIKKFYNRDSTIIYPPVKVAETIQPVKKSPTKQDGYYLYVNRLALSKHPEIAVEACTRLGLPLKVVGQGKMLPLLQEKAGPTIEFLGEVDDKKLHQVYSGATALLYPVEDEDFGMIPVEAMGHGIPVIAHKSGGPKETIREGITGIFFTELNADAFINAIKKGEKVRWDREKIHSHALQFNEARFQTEVKEFVNMAIEKQTELGRERTE